MNFPMNVFSTAQDPFKQSVYWICNLIILGIGIYIGMRCFKKMKKTPFQDSQLLPLDYDTSAYLIRGGNAASDFIIATLLSFYKKGAVNLTLSSFTTRGGTQKPNYIFRPLCSNQLTDTEKCLYRILFTDYDEISTRELNRLRREAGTDYNEAFGNYLTYLDDYLQKLGLKSKEKNGTFAIFIFLIALLALIIALFSLAGGFYFGCINLLNSFLLCFFCIVTLGTLPPKGKAHYDFYRKLHQQLKDANLNDHNDKWLLYGIAYGLSYKELYQIYQKVHGKDFHFYFDQPTESTFHKLMKESLVGNMKLPHSPSI